MKIMGIDPGAKFGWSVLEDGKYVDGGMTESKYPTESKQRSGVPKGTKWLEIQRLIESLITIHAPDLVIAESVRRHVGTAAAHSYGFIRYAVEAECAKQGIRFVAVEVSEWKKLAAGKGSAGKDEVMEAMSLAYGIDNFVSDDHSDSLGIAHAGLSLS